MPNETLVANQVHQGNEKAKTKVFYQNGYAIEMDLVTGEFVSEVFVG